MTLCAIEDVLVELANSVPEAAGDADGTLLVVTRMQFDLPLESRFVSGGALHGSLPRGMLATGFDPRLGRIRAIFERSEP